MRRIILALTVLAFPAAAQDRFAPPGLWAADPSADCSLSIRDASPAWRVRLDIVRPRSGRAIVIIGINQSDAPLPRAGVDHLRLVWVAADGTETAHDLQVAGARPPSATPLRPLLAHGFLPADAPETAALLAKAGAARRLRLSLPGIAPIELPSTGFAEAWSALDTCARQ